MVHAKVVLAGVQQEKVEIMSFPCDNPGRGIIYEQKK